MRAVSDGHRDGTRSLVTPAADVITRISNPTAPTAKRHVLFPLSSWPIMASTKSARVTTPRFEGFADQGASFFKRLEKNQNKTWFDAHKAEYEDGWLRPMQALLSEARAALDKAYAHAELGEPHVMRIYRDVRFSKDKSPYKTWIGGGVPLASSGKTRMPDVPSALYFHVGAKELIAGAGLYMIW